MVDDERHRVSLKDVASRAGVSYQTVSRVINGGERTSEATRERVLAVIAELGYRRNEAARALVTSRSRTIGVIADASPRYGPVSTLAAVESAARDAGYTALVTTMHQPDWRVVVDAFNGFIERGVEGIIVVAPRLPLAKVSQEISVPVPVVILAPGESSHAGYTVFYEDQGLGARLATRHLIQLGHTQVAHLAGNQEWLDGQVRLRGWQAELRDAGLPALPVRYGYWSGESAYKIGKRMLAAGLPTSIFIASDLMALAFMRALYEAGVRVPEDISVVGFDDNEFAPHMYPPLTTVRQSFDTVGSRCMSILLDLIDGRSPDVAPAAPRLVLRQSTAAPAASR